MGRDLRFTVYDFIGYLLPGAPGVVAVVLLGWAVSGATSPLSLPIPSLEGWIAIGLASYLVGHAVQALANLIVRVVGLDEVGGLGTADGPVPLKTYGKALDQVTELTGIEPSAPADLYAVCDEWVAQHGETADRELYQYREGFYRGFAVSLFVLAIALAVVRLRGGSLAAIGTMTPALNNVVCWSFVVLLVLTTALFSLRYRRFLRYRVRSAVIAFLVLAAAPRHERSKE